MSTRKPLATLVAALATMVALTLSASPATAVPDLDVTISPTSVPAGETFTVSISGTSDGNWPDAHLAIYVLGTTGPELNEFSSLVGCTGNTGPCIDNYVDPITNIPAGYGIPLGDLTTGQAIDATITVRVDRDAPIRDFVLLYEFSSGNTLVRPLGPTFTITEPPAEADMGVSLTATSTGLLTSRVSHTLRVDNNGPDPVSSATVQTSFTGPVNNVSSADGCVLNAGQVDCQIGPIPPGESVTKRFDAHLGLLTVGLPFSATATRTASDPTDPNPANDTSTDSCTVVTPLLIHC